MCVVSDFVNGCFLSCINWVLIYNGCVCCVWRIF